MLLETKYPLKMVFKTIYTNPSKGVSNLAFIQEPKVDEFVIDSTLNRLGSVKEIPQWDNTHIFLSDKQEMLWDLKTANLNNSKMLYSRISSWIKRMN